MSGREAGACDWFAKADTDFRSAWMLADLSGPPETICFLAQQGAEKYLKGYLVWHGVTFRKVHDMLEILNGCRNVEKAFGQLEDDCRALNPYAVEVRYPGFEAFYDDEYARDALERANVSVILYGSGLDWTKRGWTPRFSEDFPAEARRPMESQALCRTSCQTCPGGYRARSETSPSPGRYT
jgi:HEPN domain-containing protein